MTVIDRDTIQEFPMIFGYIGKRFIYSLVLLSLVNRRRFTVMALLPKNYGMLGLRDAAQLLRPPTMANSYRFC